MKLARLRETVMIHVLPQPKFREDTVAFVDHSVAVAAVP